MQRYSLKKIDFTTTLFLLLTPLAAIISVFYWIKLDGLQYGQVILGIVLYFITGISITAGYHRYLAHKAYDAHPVVKFLFLFFGSAAFQASALKWASDHRLHHSKVDTDQDPYSINKGFFYAHIGWLLIKDNSEVKTRYAKDLLADKMIVWQHKYYLPLAIISGFLLPTLLGGLFFGSYLGGLAVGGFARIVLLHHCTFFINSLCHYLGTTPYTDTNTARDSWFMAYLTFGEGYHNFHHFFQTDYRNGILWYQYDPTKWLINFLKYSGLAYKLKSTSQDKILAARMQMKVIELKQKIGPTEMFLTEVEGLKARALEAFQNFQELKDQYKAAKRAQATQSLRELKAKIQAAKLEFESTLREWHMVIELQTKALA